jgi:hypothetical protein
VAGRPGTKPAKGDSGERERECAGERREKIISEMKTSHQEVS